MEMDKTEGRATAFSVRLADAVAKYGEVIANGKVQTAEVKAELAALAKLGKLTPDRVAQAITTKWIEKHPEWKPGGKKAAPVLREDYAVFSDTEHHTCIRVARDSKHVQFIPMAGELTIYELTHYEFEKQYSTQLTDYPVKKAAATYLGAEWLSCTPAAKKHLEFICGKSFVDPVTPINFDKKESIMTEAAKKAAASKKPAPSKPATKVEKPVAGKPAAKPATKVAPAKTPAPGKALAAAGAPAKFSGKKIQLVEKTNPKRALSASFDRYALYKDGMPVDTFIEKGGLAADIAYDVKKGFIKLV